MACLPGIFVFNKIGYSQPISPSQSLFRAHDGQDYFMVDFDEGYSGTAQVAAMLPVSHNGYWIEAASDVQGFNDGENNLDTDPLFRDPAVGDYRLASDSPTINAGSTEGAPETDIEGTPRDANPDRGAYEYVSR